LHLYLGLFISPFILVFSLSVFFLNHRTLSVDTSTEVSPPRPVRVPAGMATAQGPASIVLAQQILSQVGLTGEIGFTRYVPSTRHFFFPVSKAGVEATVDVDVEAATAVVSRRRTSLLEAFAYLHKMPGPHNATIRGNWIGTRLWRPAADATIYLTLFVSITGVYLWYALKAERAVGATLLACGIVSLLGMVYALVR
jgi:hypothetical protein